MGGKDLRGDDYAKEESVSEKVYLYENEMTLKVNQNARRIFVSVRFLHL